MTTYDLTIGPSPAWSLFKYDWVVMQDNRIVVSGRCDTVWGCKREAKKHLRKQKESAKIATRTYSITEK